MGRECGVIQVWNVGVRVSKGLTIKRRLSPWFRLGRMRCKVTHIENILLLRLYEEVIIIANPGKNWSSLPLLSCCELCCEDSPLLIILKFQTIIVTESFDLTSERSSNLENSTGLVVCRKFE